MGTITERGHVTASNTRWQGVMIAAIIREVAVAADAVSNASTLTDSYKIQRDLQNSLLNIAEEQQNLLKNYYWPKELTFLEEFCTPEEVEEVNVYGRRFAGHLMAAVAKTFAQQIKKLKCSIGRYHTSQYVTSLQMTYQAQATAMANAKVLGFIKGFTYAKAKDNTNDQRRLQAIGLGRDLLQEAAALYKNALGGLAGVSGLAMRGLGNAVEELGRGFKDITDAYANSKDKDSEAVVTSEETYAAMQNAWNRYGEASGWNLLFGGGGTGAFSTGSSLDAVSISSAADLQDGGMNDASNSIIDFNSPIAATTSTPDENNPGKTGGYDTNRTGSHTYKWQDSRGDDNELTINLDTDFPNRVRTDTAMRTLTSNNFSPKESSSTSSSSSGG